jgi:hypothetical protein
MNASVYLIARRTFLQGIGTTAAIAVAPSVRIAAAAAAAQPAAPVRLGVMALFEGCGGYWGDLVMAIGAPDADPRGLAEELLDEMIERDRPADVLPSEMVFIPEGDDQYWSEMPGENREAAIAYLAAQFRPRFGRWDCGSRGEYDECKTCTQCAAGNDLLCGGDDDDYPPLFDTCRPDATGAGPYLIWEPDDGL